MKHGHSFGNSSTSSASPAGACLHEQACLLADDVQRFNELKEAMSGGLGSTLTASFVSMYKSSGTIANERCYIAVSRVGGLGLFAAQSFAKDEVVTAYGGGLRTATFVRSMGKDALTHARRVPNSDNVQDGKPWAAFFESASRELALDIVAEQKLDAAQRTRVEPIDVDLKRVAMGMRSLCYSCSLLAFVQKRASFRTCSRARAWAFCPTTLFEVIKTTCAS
jgi:hypothetical protein